MNMLSVIMPSLNVVDYIKECMDSVLAQTGIAMEIICVDAGSTDGTLEILNQYAAIYSCIQVFHSEKKSYGYQMNLGLRAAKGDYVGIVETDDYIVPGMFQNLYNIAKNENVDFVKSGYTSFFEYAGKRYYVNNQNKSTKKINGKKLNLNEQKEYRLADINHIWSGIYRKKFLFDNDIWFHETPGASFQDTSFSVLVGLVAENCVYTQDSYYHYRTDRDESSVKSDAKYKCIVDEFIYVDNFLKSHNRNKDEYKRMLESVKLGAYKWNMLRLTEKSRDLFRAEIHEEMVDYVSGEKDNSYLSAGEKETIQLLTDPMAIMRLEERQEQDKKKILRILQQGKCGKEFIFVGAGQYFQTFLCWQKIFGCNLIKEVCDNNKELQGKEISGYKIISVEEAAMKYSDKQWIVANKYYSKEIQTQLLELEISKNNIICISSLPEASAIIYEVG